MPDRHKHGPIPFRPPEGYRARLLAYAEQTGIPVNRILADALAAYLDDEVETDWDRAAARSTATIPKRQKGKDMDEIDCRKRQEAGR